MKIKRLINEYSTVDLLRYGTFELISSVDRVLSTVVFRIKMCISGAKLGKSPKVWGRVYLHRFPGSQIEIGDNVRIISRPYRYSQNIFPQSKLKTMSRTAHILIGKNVGFNAISILARSQNIEIGENTLIGGNCQITDTDGHPLWPPESRNYYPGNEHDKGVVIGKNVFIGLNVIILKGSVIGNNSVIGAGSLVTGTIPANCVASGVPARVIRSFVSRTDEVLVD